MPVTDLSTAGNTQTRSSLRSSSKEALQSTGARSARCWAIRELVASGQGRRRPASRARPPPSYSDARIPLMPFRSYQIRSPASLGRTPPRHPPSANATVQVGFRLQAASSACLSVKLDECPRRLIPSPTHHPHARGSHTSSAVPIDL